MSRFIKEDITISKTKFENIGLLNITEAFITLLLLVLAVVVSFKIYEKLDIDIKTIINFWFILSMLYILLLLLNRTTKRGLHYIFYLFFGVAIGVVYIVLLKLKQDFIQNNLESILIIGLSLSVLMAIPFTFIIFPKRLLANLYHFALKYRFFNVNNHDFYTNCTDYELAIEQNSDAKDYDTIFLVSTKVNQNSTKNINFSILKQNFAKIIYFWYASKYNKVFLRFIFPMWSVVFSIIFFSTMLALLLNLNISFQKDFFRMVLVVMFLTILAMSMIYQLNNSLDARNYLLELNKEFKESQINFNDIKLSQKVLLFLDKTFKIYIYDKNYNTIIKLNNNKSFERFILKADLDIEGRNNIAHIYVTLFIVVYLEIFVQVLSAK